MRILTKLVRQSCRVRIRHFKEELSQRLSRESVREMTKATTYRSYLICLQQYSCDKLLHFCERMFSIHVIIVVANIPIRIKALAPTLLFPGYSSVVYTYTD